MKNSKREKGPAIPEEISRLADPKASPKKILSKRDQKLKGKMILGGSLVMNHPYLEPADLRFEYEKMAMEFNLHQLKDKADLEFDFWINCEKADIFIQTSVGIDDEFFKEIITLVLKDGSGRELDITLNVDQARIVHDFLERFLECSYGLYALAEKRIARI